MDDLCLKTEIVLNECTRSLHSIQKGESNELLYFKTIFETFINGPLQQFVKSVQVFFKTCKSKNIYLICVCLSQIRKCLLMYESIELDRHFEKLLTTYIIKRIQKCFFKLEEYLEILDLTDGDELPGMFIDKMNSVLNGLNNREHFDEIKPNIDIILFQAITIAKISEKTDSLEITSSSKQVLQAIQQFEKKNINEADSFFQFDYLSSSLSILERRINTAILHLICKIFNDPFCIMKTLIKKCGDSVDLQLRNKSDLSSMICDLDKSTDELIQIGLFSVACCKNNEYVIPLKCCISSLELLDSDIVPAIIEFYLDPTSMVRKTFLKLLVNHWVCEINGIKNILDKIIDPFAFTQITLEASINIIDDIRKSDLNTNDDLYVKLLNGLVNFTKYIEKIFLSKISKENELSTAYKQFNNALKEYSACLVFNGKRNHGSIDQSIKKKLLQRCKIIIKYLTNIQTLILSVMEDKSFSELENTYFILTKTEQSSKSLLQKNKCSDNDDLNFMLSTVKLQKSFYNKSERKTSKIFNDQEYLTNDETTYENTVTMDITNILDNFIETCNTNSVVSSAFDLWEDIGIDTY